MNTHRSKRECVVIMFHIIYSRLCFQHQLIQYLVIQLFRFYNEEKVGHKSSVRNEVLREWREQDWSEILEVLTPVRGYLMFFNKRGLTASPLVSLSNPIHFFSINSFLLKCPSCPHPTVILRKILDCGYSYLRKLLCLFLDLLVVGKFLWLFLDPGCPCLQGELSFVSPPPWHTHWHTLLTTSHVCLVVSSWPCDVLRTDRQEMSVTQYNCCHCDTLQ
jgi:hypothetical protein